MKVLPALLLFVCALSTFGQQTAVLKNAFDPPDPPQAQVGFGARRFPQRATATTDPAIIVQPASISVYAGTNASFNVTATGTGTLTYQWQINGRNILGATSSSYTTNIVAISDNGATFDVIVTSAGGTLTSNKATLTVTNAPPSAQQMTISGTGINGTPVSQIFDPTKPITATIKFGNGLQITGGAVQPLTVSAINPNTGPAGTAVTITGTGFTQGATVGLFCPTGTTTSIPMTNVTIISSTTLNAVSPAMPSSIPTPVWCDVWVTTP